jgi:hypothetical protein
VRDLLCPRIDVRPLAVVVRVPAEGFEQEPPPCGPVIEINDSRKNTIVAGVKHVFEFADLLRLLFVDAPFFVGATGKETRRGLAALVAIGLMLARPWTLRRETANTATHSIVAQILTRSGSQFPSPDPPPAT